MIHDIRPLKMRMRQEAKQYRQSLSPQEKERIDRKITNKLLGLWSFRDADTVLLYMATEIEVETRSVIDAAWAAEKKVAVPRCIDGTRQMQFYYIAAYDDLECGSFGVMEPIVSRCEAVTDFSCALCVVPALVFDKNCFRLGYGKGYYDRFLSSFEGTSIGLCYEACRREKIPHGKFDKALNLFITENRIYAP